MRIIEKTKFSGKRGAIIVRSLMDSGADRSMIPTYIVKIIGARSMRKFVRLTGIHGYPVDHPVYKVRIYFPEFNKGDTFEVATYNSKKCLIGHDVMGALGIELQPQTGKASATNKIEEFIESSLAVVGAFYLISKLPDISDYVSKILRKIKII